MDVAPVPVRRPWIPAAAALAAGIAAVIYFGAWWLVLRDSQDKQMVSRASIQKPAPKVEEPDVAEIIDRAGRIARLAASAEMLSRDPSLRPYKEQADRYLLEVYGYRRPDG